ncbi:MAG TPA: hypothetical protein VLA97_06955 [Nocardioidaceae bacterium]|nr:hypothetical protein [Nocardioidaceae bacterium]
MARRRGRVRPARSGVPAFRPGRPVTGLLGIAAAVALATVREGTRLVRTTPVLLLVVAIFVFLGAWEEGFDRLWEAQLLLALHAVLMVCALGFALAGSVLLGRAVRHHGVQPELVEAHR